MTPKIPGVDSRERFHVFSFLSGQNTSFKSSFEVAETTYFLSAEGKGLTTENVKSWKEVSWNFYSCHCCLTCMTCCCPSTQTTGIGLHEFPVTLSWFTPFITLNLYRQGEGEGERNPTKLLSTTSQPLFRLKFDTHVQMTCLTKIEQDICVTVSL